MDRINRHSKLPYYQQLYEILHAKLQRGEWKPGDLVPGEAELVAQFQISRNTARQVFDMLVNDGLIYRQRGRGSFVAHPTVEQAMTRIISFTEDMRQRGFAPGTRVLSASLMPAPDEIAARLQIEPGEELARIERLRLADGEPMSVEESYLVHALCPGVHKHDYARSPLREVLGEYGIRLVRARQAIRAVPASRALAALLCVKPHAALLLIERVSSSQAGIPVEFLRVYYRGDRYSLAGELHD